MARQQVLPYLVVEDLEDGDVVVEETLLGCHTSHKIASFRRYHNLATFGQLRWTFKSPARKQKGPSYLKEVRQ